MRIGPYENTGKLRMRSSRRPTNGTLMFLYSSHQTPARSDQRATQTAETARICRFKLQSSKHCIWSARAMLNDFFTTKKLQKTKAQRFLLWRLPNLRGVQWTAIFLAKDARTVDHNRVFLIVPWVSGPNKEKNFWNFFHFFLEKHRFFRRGLKKRNGSHRDLSATFHRGDQWPLDRSSVVR